MMIRGALRQSSRTVGALSATGRVASVRCPEASTTLNIGCPDVFLSHIDRPTARCELLPAVFILSPIPRISTLCSEGCRANMIFRAASSLLQHTTLSPNRLVATLRPKHLPLRSLLSLNKESVACQKKRVSQRPAVSSQSGMKNT